MDICTPHEGPYMGIVKDVRRKFPNGRTLRFLIYRAYNAMGLIGSECNGIVVLDEDKMKVVADEICKTDSGYSVPTKRQLELFTALTETGTFEYVRSVIASSGRARYVP